MIGERDTNTMSERQSSKEKKEKKRKEKKRKSVNNGLTTSRKSIREMESIYGKKKSFRDSVIGFNQESPDNNN